MTALILSIILQAMPVASIPGADMTMYDLYVENLGSDREKAMEYAELFLNNLDSVVTEKNVIAMSDSLSVYYENEKFLFSKAIRWAEFSLDSYKALGDVPKQAETEYHLAKLYFQKGQYNKTLLYATEAEDIFRKNEDETRLLDCYNLLGAVYYICKDPETSHKYFQMFANGARAQNDSLRLIYALNNSAQLSRSSDVTKSISLYQESIRLCKATNDSSLLCQVYLNLADTYIENGEYDKAGQSIGDAAPLVRSVDSQGHYYRSLGILRLLQGSPEDAILNLRKAVDCYSQGEFDLKRQFCLDVLHPIYAAQGQYAEAYRTLDEYYIADKENSPQNVYLELFRARDEIKLNSEREQLKVQRIRFYLLLLSVVFAATIIILCVSFRVKKRSYAIRQREIEVKNQILTNEKKENEIRTKNEILEIKKMQQFQMDMLVKEVVGRLNKLEKQLPAGETQRQISQICSELDGYKGDKDWKEISQFIPEFNSAFFRNLLKDFPDLSVNERRLCAMLDMNMTTKEISEITKQTPHSINIARCRLRNKFNLTGRQESIQEFLSRYNVDA